MLNLDQSYKKHTCFKIINYGTAQYFLALRLREDVLKKPLGLLFSLKEIEEEKDYIHVIGYARNKIISSAILLIQGNKCKIRRVAVKESSQNQKIGSKMLHFCENISIAHSCRSIYCYARSAVKNFYLQNGYQDDGEYFEENDIEHLKMSKNLLI